MSSNGIKGTFSGKYKWKDVSINNAENDVKLHSYCYLRANLSDILYTFPNAPSPNKFC